MGLRISYSAAFTRNMRQNIKRSKIVTVSTVRNFDKKATKVFLIPSIVLMENAGKNVADIILREFKPKSVSIFCGGGNNGGDGFVVARHLYNNNVKVKVFVVHDEYKYSGDARINLKIVKRIKIPVNKISNIKGKLRTDLIIDALLGTGTSGELRETYKEIIKKINSLKKPVVSIDVPSGIDADTGLSLGAVVKANATVTMAAIKKGLLKNEGKKNSGKIYVVDIGIKAEVSG